MINTRKLILELQTAGLPVNECSGDGRIGYTTTPTQEQLDLAAAIVAAHDPTDFDALSAENTRLRWAQFAAFKGKNPAEIHTLVQRKIDSWASLADAKADLRQWLPLLIAAAAWSAIRDARTT